VWSRRSWLAWLRAYPGRFARLVAAQYRRWLATHRLAGSAATCRDVMRRPAWSWTTPVARPYRDRPLAGRARGDCRVRLAERAPARPSVGGERAPARPSVVEPGPCESRAVSAGNSQDRPTTGAVLRVMSPSWPAATTSARPPIIWIAVLDPVCCEHIRSKTLRASAEGRAEMVPEACLGSALNPERTARNCAVQDCTTS
jgi:hypothetical protein